MLLVVVSAGMRWAYVNATQIVVDEFEHLHAAYLVAHGQTPYVDFFEHHTPLFYYLAAAVLPLRSPTFATIIDARYLALAFSAVTMLLAWWLVRRVYGRTEALVVACLLLGNFFLFARGSLSYLDTYAALPVMLSALCLVGRRRRAFRCFAAGVALGLAVLVTQKTVVAALAPAVIFVARGRHEWRARSERFRWLSDVVACAAGALMPAALLVALLGVGGLGDFFRDNVLLNLAWKARHFPAKELAVLGVTDGAVYALAIVGAAVQLWQFLRRGLVVTDEDVPALFLASLAAGIFLLPVVWEEYFIVLVPFAVIVAGVTLTRWARQYLWVGGRLEPFGGVSRRVASWALPALFGLMLVDLIGRKLAPANPLSSTAFLAVVGLWLLVLGWIRVTAATDGGYRRATLWLAFFLAFPLVEQADWIHHNSNAEQRERVAYVLSHTGPNDTVFDGYSGFGVFRPHAYRYWFLHEEVQKMLSKDERSTKIIQALEREKTPIVIEDQYVAALPASVRAYIDNHYERTRYSEILKRKDVEAAHLAPALRVAPAS
jgi:Dolichyl-phosphate-mannose-protein mannosyltransferase